MKMMDKKGIAFEQLTKIIIALIVLVVIIAVFYTLLKGPINQMLGIEETNAESGGGVLDGLSKALGIKCEDGETKCNSVSNTIRECRDSEWVTTEDPCLE